MSTIRSSRENVGTNNNNNNNDNNADVKTTTPTKNVGPNNNNNADKHERQQRMLSMRKHNNTGLISIMHKYNIRSPACQSARR
jgi:hypothetical protein